METNIEDIYAAGDVAEFNGKVYGLWNIAIGQGKTAGYNISGKDNIYRQIVPVITLSAFNLSLFSMGEIENDNSAHVFVERTSGNDYRMLNFKNDQVVGAIVVGDIKSSPALKTAIENRIKLENIDYPNISFGEIIKRIKESK